MYLYQPQVKWESGKPPDATEWEDIIDKRFRQEDIPGCTAELTYEPPRQGCRVYAYVSRVAGSHSGLDMTDEIVQALVDAGKRAWR